MKYIIMAAGEGKRWNNYLGVPKHLIEINGETLLGRTTRLLKENGIEDYVITGSDERYKEYGKVIEQSKHDCEVDRFEEVAEPVCYLYGDVYYSEAAIKRVINVEVEDILFLGGEFEIFAVKVKDLDLFYKHKNRVKKLYLEKTIGRCIGWEVYRSLQGIKFEEHIINGRYEYMIDETDDIDYPADYEEFKRVREELK